jgi:type IV secretion system protein VirB10
MAIDTKAIRTAAGTAGANETDSDHAPNGPIQDHREKPPGVMPRKLRTWIMVGVAAVILLVSLLAGHSQPVAAPQMTQRTTPQATLISPERMRGYQQQLNDTQVRLEQMQAQAAAAVRQGPAAASAAASASAGQSGSASSAMSAPTANDQIADDQRRREYQSLFADNVVFSRRVSGQQAAGEGGQRGGGPTPSLTAVSPETLAAIASARAQAASLLSPGGAPTTPAALAEGHAGAVTTLPPPPQRPTGSSARVPDENPAPGPRLRLLEGTVIETVLLNRLDGTFAGPVECLVTTPVYSHDRQAVLIPAGARVLGAAAPVQSRGDSRLAVSFHRLVMPDGHSYSLEAFKGLDQSGATGITDEVNRHYMQVFGASLAIGAVSGLAQYSTRGADATTFSDAYRQSAGASLATSTSNVLDRYLNVLPTITIREGFRIKVYLTNDFELPAYAGTGGVS